MNQDNKVFGEEPDGGPSKKLKTEESLSQQEIINERINQGLRASDEDLKTLLATIVQEFGGDVLKEFQAVDKHKSKLQHLLVMKKKPLTIQEVQGYLDWNVGRASDQCTPLHLSKWTKSV